MSRWERVGRRDMTYSTWHRALPYEMGLVDLDWIAWCKTCGHVLFVYETARDDGRQDDHNTRLTREVALRGGWPGYLVLYAVSGGTVTGFRVRRIAPDTEPGFTSYTPEQWAQFLMRAYSRCHPVQRTSDAPPVVAAGPCVHQYLNDNGWRCVRCGAEWRAA